MTGQTFKNLSTKHAIKQEYSSKSCRSVATRQQVNWQQISKYVFKLSFHFSAHHRQRWVWKIWLAHKICLFNKAKNNKLVSPQGFTASSGGSCAFIEYQRALTFRTAGKPLWLAALSRFNKSLSLMCFTFIQPWPYMLHNFHYSSYCWNSETVDPWWWWWRRGVSDVQFACADY